MSVPNIGTCLSPWGLTGASPSRLALFARPAPPACGLDRLAPARQGLAKQVRQKCSAACKHFYAVSR